MEELPDHFEKMLIFTSTGQKTVLKSKLLLQYNKAILVLVFKLYKNQSSKSLKMYSPQLYHLICIFEEKVKNKTEYIK